MSILKFTFVFIVLLEYLGTIHCGSIIKDVNFDENCPQDDIIVHDIRVTDCDKLPCTIKRGKRYWVEGDFEVWRHFELPGHGGCSNLVNDSCPVVEGKIYTSSTNFKLPYYVPPMMYTVYCSMVDDDDNNMMCGWGSGNVK